MRTILLVLDLVSIFYNLIFTIIEWLNEQICLSNAQTSYIIKNLQNESLN